MTPIRFRIYPEKKTLFFSVNIWPTKKAMHEFHNKIDRPDQPRLSKYSVGCFCGMERWTYKPHKQGHKSPFMGDIHLIQGKLHYDVVSHEIHHAAFHWAHRVGGILSVIADPEANHVTAEEERLCYGHSKMLYQVASKLHELGFWHVVSTKKRSRLKTS